MNLNIIDKIITVKNDLKSIAFFKSIFLQIIIHFSGLVGGILVIRFLSISDYAIYVVSNTVLSSMVLVADAGITSGVLSQGGKVFDNREKFSDVIVTGLKLRKKFTKISLLIFSPILFYLLIKNSCSINFAIITAICVIFLFYSRVYESILEVPLQLKLEVIKLQKIRLYQSLIKLFFNGAVLFVFPVAFIGLLGNLFSQYFVNNKLKKNSEKYFDQKQSEDSEIKDEILIFVRRLLPSSLYFSISGQMTIWLISFYGNPECLAQVAALGRFEIPFIIFGSALYSYLIPQFARLSENKKTLRSTYVKSIIIYLFFGFSILIGLVVFSGFLLKILGSQYTELKNEFSLLMLSSCIMFINSGIQGLNYSRGWIFPAVFLIPFSFIYLLTCVIFFNPHDTISAAVFSLFISLQFLITNITLSILGLKGLK